MFLRMLIQKGTNCAILNPNNCRLGRLVMLFNKQKSLVLMGETLQKKKNLVENRVSVFKGKNKIKLSVKSMLSNYSYFSCCIKKCEKQYYIGNIYFRV